MSIHETRPSTLYGNIRLAMTNATGGEMRAVTIRSFVVEDDVARNGSRLDPLFNQEILPVTVNRRYGVNTPLSAGDVLHKFIVVVES